MSSKSFQHSLRRLWALDKFSYSVRVFVALTGSMAFCWYQDEMSLLIPLFLGIIASALSETDDSWQGRLNALLVTLVCFTASALSVELLFPYPWLMVCALALASFGLTMLGALGERYGAIASATLILAVYTMIGVDQRGGEVTNFWHEPLLLVAGAAWYGMMLRNTFSLVAGSSMALALAFAASRTMFIAARAALRKPFFCSRGPRVRILSTTPLSPWIL